MNKSFFQPEVDLFDPLPVSPCEACPQTHRGGFCGARIHPDCLRIDREGTVRVSLSASPEAWFETITQLGEVLHVTRNPVGVLHRMGNAPVIRCFQNAPLLSDTTGDFLPSLAEFASLWAVRENTPTGALYGLEVRDATRKAFDRIILPEGADHAILSRFVVDYQSPPEEAGGWFSPNHLASANRRRQLAKRIPRLRLQWGTGDRAIRRLPVRFVSKLLTAATLLQVEIRTTVYQPALIRSETWTPQSGPVGPCAESALEFINGDRTSLYLDQRGIASVWLWKGRCSCCSERRWRIEVGDSSDSIGLSIMPGDNTPELEWQNLLKTCLP